MDASGVGGFDFAADPALNATEAEIFWRPECCSSIVMLDSHPALSSMLIYAPQNWPDLRSRRSTWDGDYLILGARRRQHRLWLPGPPAPGAALAALIPFDKSTVARSAATLRFLRHIDGVSSAGAAQIHDKRFSEMLRALDGHLAKASYRDIAQQLFGHERLNREPWKTSSIRAMTIRLVRGGIAMMRGGYRKLLTK
ncbi:MAG: hypothetical protein CTY36_16755 [Methylocystis sp.]|nr:MAG: hypothetical protein CTY36_16755 [Methylocystis sp.]